MRRWQQGGGGLRRSIVMVGAASVAVAGIVVAPIAASGATRPSTAAAGTATVSPDTVVSPTPTTLRITYTASTPITDGVVTVDVPTGWTSPTTTNTTASTGTVATVGTTVTVSAVTLTSGQSLVVTYGAGAHAVLPASNGAYDTFTVSMAPTASGTPTAIATSPVVFVYALAQPALLKDLTTVPLAVFNKVGVSREPSA